MLGGLTLVAVLGGLLWLGGRIRALQAELAARKDALEKLTETIRQEFHTTREAQARDARDARMEQGESLTRVATGLKTDLQTQLTAFSQQLEQFRQTLTDANKDSREAQAQSLKELTENQRFQFGRMAEELGKLTTTIADQLKNIRESSEQKLEKMRETVDEKLQSTLEKRLGESFKQVSERLEQVHLGLGEMKHLATGVSDLKNVLANVKARGTFGEMRLEALLEQLMTADQYSLQQAVVPGSRELVDAAIKLPGSREGVVWLPIDAKFPLVEYEKLVNAAAEGNEAEVSFYRTELLKTLRGFAKSIHQKYIQPPHTTDFALLFLPVEGLFSEALREPGLLQELQQVHKVVLTGPTTLSAILHSLQMGFRTLAIEKRSSEVWEVLKSVKAEFENFGVILTKAKGKLESATKDLEHLEGTRTRAINRKLRGVEFLPEETPAGLLPTPDLFDEGEIG